MAAMKLTADVDQLIEGVKGMARAAWAYYDTLRKQGFTAQQAMTLTLEWQRALFQQKPQRDG